MPLDPRDKTGVAGTPPKGQGGPSFFSEKRSVFRWALLLGTLVLSVFALIVFWESAIESGMDFHLRESPTPPSEVPSPLLERAPPFPKMDPWQDVPKKSPPPASLALNKEETSLDPLLSLEMKKIVERLGLLEQRFSALLDIINREGKRQNLGALFLLLRQDVRLGVPFSSSLESFQSQLPNGPLKEKFKMLEAFAHQGVWPFGKILTEFSSRYFLAQPEKGGFWHYLSGLFQNLWIVRQTDHPKSLFEQTLQEAEQALRYGHLEGALKRLASLPLSSDKKAQEWFLEADKLMKAECAFHTFEQHFFQSALLEPVL